MTNLRTKNKINSKYFCKYYINLPIPFLILTLTARIISIKNSLKEV